MEIKQDYLLRVDYVLENEIRATIVNGEGELKCRMPREHFPEKLERGDMFHYVSEIRIEMLKKPE